SSDRGKKRRAGLFTIEFDHLTDEIHRSRYERETHTIYINLDHPQIENTLKSSGGALDSYHFLEVVYEIACVEYAMAIPYEQINQGELLDTADTLFSLRDTIDRVTRKLALVLASR
ncbi:MAG: hypothetical protein MUO76_18185, partial [Anaerolineaceae bacterium]|nr:hypothetical protein [Anaerolineaceae bacterium]